MGTTGSTAEGKMNNTLPSLVSRVRQYSSVPLAVGFGVYTRAHFETVAEAGADAVVVGSRVVSVIREAGPDIPNIAKSITEFCAELTLKGKAPATQSRAPGLAPIPPKEAAVPESLLKVTEALKVTEPIVLPARFGQFGGQYVPEALVDCLLELEDAHKAALVDPEFWKEFESHYGYMNRPSNLYEAARLSEHVGGANIWFKREDLYVYP